MARSIGGEVLILDTDHGCTVQMTIPSSQIDPSAQAEAYYEIGIVASCTNVRFTKQEFLLR
jgi:hypothetical protein